MSSKVVFTVGAVLRGDDAAGPMLAKMMEDDPIDGWEIIDGGQMPEDFLAVIRRKSPDILLLVDAADMGLEPGAIRTLDEDSVATDFMVTTHSLPITFLLKELKESCGQVVFLGIQPAQMEFFGALTPEVDQAVQRIYRSLSHGADFDAIAPVGEEDAEEQTGVGEE
jgi:hydrogenase 3 maturation protease